jgi:hypothetical protein
MKKKVRIFKAGGDTGAYLNKTAQWMMQMGGTPDISQIGYPSQQPQQVSEEDITNLIISDLSNQIPEDQIAFKLVTIHKLEPVVAQQFISSVKDMLVKQNEEYEDEDVQEEKVAEAEMFTNEEEPEFETEDEQALYQNTSGQDDDDTEFAADLIMKYGGSKRNYVNSVLKLVKKQMGGDTKSDDTDPIGENVRKKQTDSFVNIVKNQAVIAQVKDQAEKQYEQMMQQQALQNFIPNYEEQDYMQFGGQRRAMRQFNKAMKNLPVTMQPVTKFDVRRSGLFGRPKEYSIEFGMNPLMQLANPMLASMYGYGRVPTGTKSQGRIVTETVAKANNKNSTKEIASQTNSEAAAKSAQPTLEEMRAAAEAAGDAGTWGTSPASTTTQEKSNVPEGVTKLFEKNPPKVGETNSAYLMRVTGNPGYYNNTDVWDGTKFVGNSLNKKQQGGVIDNPMPDQFGNLQKFISGGYDPSQADIDDVYSKDTSDPYKASEGWQVTNPNNVVDTYNPRFGSSISNRYPVEQNQQNPFGNTPNMLGNFGNQIMGNYGFYNPLINNRALPGLPQYMGSWNKMVGTPYDKRTGQQFMGIPGFNPNAQISNIDVTKTGILGRPKKFSVTYNNNPSGKPEDRRLAGSSFTGMPNMNTNSKSYGNQPGRQRPFYAGKKYETDFEDVDPTPRLSNLEYMQQAKANNSKQDTDYTKQFQEQQKAKGLMWNESLNKWVPSTQEQPVNSQTNLEKVRPVGNITYEQRNRAMSPSPEKLNELYNRDVFNDYKYGGLHKFLPQAQPGVQTPVTQDERFEPLPMMSSKQAGQNLFNQSRENIMSQAQFEPDQYTQDFKRKDIFGGNAAEALPWINAGVLGAAGMINRYRDKDREAAMYENLTADNLYASDPSRDRGDYETNSGLYRPDEMGQKWNSRSKQFGGEMDYEEGDEVDMTEEELEEFLANGGEIY